MSPEKVKEKLMSILGQIQDDSDLDCPLLIGSTIPVEDLPGFDSIVWPVAITLLATEIGMKIPNETNIFVDEDSKAPYSIDEIVDFVCDLSRRQSEQKVVVA